MASVAAGILFWAEILVAFGLIIMIFLAFLYYSIEFVEERVRKVAKFAARFSGIVLLLSLLLIPAGYGKFSFFATFITTCLWLSVLTRGFPFISIFSWDLLAASIGTVASHCSWIASFVHVTVGALTGLAYYLAFVWGTPIVVALSLCVTDEASESRHGKQTSIWANLLGKAIGIVRGMMPGGGHRST
jgi:hypothetical protein